MYIFTGILGDSTHDGFATTPSLLKNLNQKIENNAFEIRYSYIKNIYIQFNFIIAYVL